MEDYIKFIMTSASFSCNFVTDRQCYALTNARTQREIESNCKIYSFLGKIVTGEPSLRLLYAV
jgi:hypothetical protein